VMGHLRGMNAAANPARHRSPALSGNIKRPGLVAPFGSLLL
jgi:hypothetical protein